MHIVMATAPGMTHVNPGQPGKINNQDAIAFRIYPKGSVVVLADGCGSQPHSGTGADIGANVIAQALSKELALSGLTKLNWEKATNGVTDSLRQAAILFTAGSGAADFMRTVTERFLFTAIVMVIEGDAAIIAAFGDGVVVVDDEVLIIEPPILNSPPYLGYLLLTDTAYHTDELKRHLKFSVVKSLKLSELKKGVIVGTDGLKDLVNEDLHHPSLVQPKSLQRWLNAQTAEKIQNGSFSAGKCPDDVSLVMVRTAEAQKRLIESRREVAEFKQEVARLQIKVTEVTADWERTTVARDTAEETAKQLEGQLETVTKKAKRAELLEQEVTALKTKVAELRASIAKEDRPLLSLLDGFFQALFPKKKGPKAAETGSAHNAPLPNKQPLSQIISESRAKNQGS